MLTQARGERAPKEVRLITEQSKPTPPPRGEPARVICCYLHIRCQANGGPLITMKEILKLFYNGLLKKVNFLYEVFSHQITTSNLF